MFTITKRTWVGIIITSLLLWAAIIIGITKLLMDTAGKMGGTINTYSIYGEDLREEVRCEFDEPLKYVSLIMHAYDSNEEMYADYILLAKPAEHEEIWGWSHCVWQPEDEAAWCDIYYVKPEFVHADMNIDTIGHEVTHATCGGFHD